MRSIILLILLLIVVFSPIALAQLSGGEYQITKSTWDSGGNVSTGGQYSLTGTIGQPDGNAAVSHSGNYHVAGGFWAQIVDILFKDGFESAP